MITKQLKKLLDIIASYERLAIAFSGGVDSILLLKAASMALPPEKILAVTARGPFFPKRESLEAAQAAAGFGLNHLIIDFNAAAEKEISENRPDRCYHCKKKLFTLLMEEAARRGFGLIADGGNLDDLSDYRPGAKAVRELGVISPLKEAALDKAGVRRLSAELGLASWNKPAFACLASRIPYGQTIQLETLQKIEKSEDYLLSLGFSQVRVRAHDNLARLELEPDERSRFFNQELMDQVNQQLRKIGFTHVALDLAGYQRGSLNTDISEEEIKKYSQKQLI